jgi:hypothetical protein
MTNESSKTQDSRPTTDDVRDVPHALYVNGALRFEGLTASRVRMFVGNLRFQRKDFHQDAEGAICVENRRYVPMRNGGQ